MKPLISAVAPLAEGPQWFERLYAREPNLMKVVLTPDEIYREREFPEPRPL